MDNDQIAFLERHRIGCREVEELIDAYIDGEMAPPLVARVETHLSGCESCRATVSHCRAIVDTAKTLAAEPIPPAVSARLRAALRERVGYDSPAPRPRPKLTLVK